MVKLKLPLLRALLLQVALVAPVAFASDDPTGAPDIEPGSSNNHDPSVVKLVEWFNSREGTYFNPKQEIRRAMVPEDESTQLGVFAARKILKGERLVTVPWSLTINAGREIKEPAPLTCETVRNLVKEMRLGDKSDFGPYVLHLLEQERYKSPSEWSAAGKALLNDILGGHVVEKDSLPPDDPFDWIEDDWRQQCDGSEDPFEENAVMLVVQRGEDDLMVPMFDMYKHRNGKYLNVETNRAEGVKLELTASRNIEKGEQIHNSVNMCTNCGGRAKSYGSAEVFRDYGFVEELPQRWIFRERRFSFDIEERGSGDGPTDLAVVWAKNRKPAKYVGDFLRTQINRIKRLRKVEQADEQVPEYERAKSWEYADAIVMAMEEAYKDIVGESDMCAGEEVDGTCVVSSGYDALDDKMDDMYYEEEDDQYLKPITCDNKEFMKFGDWNEDEAIKSIYQSFTFVTKPEDDDVCFDIEDIVQICNNYRPHYHEFNMDFAARYVDDVRRVIFIGGGDSMLLFEALKYPSLEKVVGLELDQKVVRKSFKYFHTQPHFDDERVEWWFGDATKSLLMLPKDYFGSFDLVLVDLSETVMSFEVTDKLDVIQALALLLKPDGVMVKNEIYLEHMAPIFDYTVQIYLPDVPSICDQIVVLGSNKADFLNYAPKDHKVKTMLLKPPDEIGDPFYLFHDYRKSDARAQGKCDADMTIDASDILKRRAGVLFVVDVEDTTVPLQPLANIVKSIVESLEKEGLSPLSTVAPASDALGEAAVTVMKEGYVVIRTWPNRKYCAFDIHLWGGFDKMEAVRDALVKVVGSSDESMSSFRIVVGGMLGTNTWEDDQKAIGPRVSQMRNCDKDTSTVVEGVSDQKSIDIALEETIGLVQNTSIVAAVLCDVESKPCKSVDVAAKNDNVRDVITLWTCPGISDDPQYLEGGEDRMIGCERDTTAALRKAVADKGKISLFIVDASAPVAMVKIANSIWSSQRNEDELLVDPVVFVAVMPDHSETWRKKHNFLDRVRNTFLYDPLFAAEIELKSAEGNKMEIGVLSSEDPGFFGHLDGAAKGIRERSGMDVEVRKVQGAMIRYQNNFDPTPFFKSADYDNRDAKEQFANQKSLGRQSVFQLDVINPASKLSASLVKSFLEHALSEMEYTVNEMKEFTDVGEGSVVVAIFSEGSAVIAWDGKTHVDINLFTFDETEAKATKFVDLFRRRFPGLLKLSLRDEMPRGTGRVINFREDLE